MILPPNKCPEREAAILDAVDSGQHWPICWSVIRSSIPDHTAVFLVMSDALRMDVETKDHTGKSVSGTGVRVSVTAKGAQSAADMLDCSMLTGKIADLIWDQADVHVPPQTMVYTEADTYRMMDTAWMIKHTQKIDTLLPGLSDVTGVLSDSEKTAFVSLPKCFSALVSTVGKHWVIEEALAKKPKNIACNYGWPVDGTPFNNATRTHKVIQPLSYMHNDEHTDYSQTLVLVSNRCLVDGSLQDLRGLLQDPALAKLANQSGPMTYIRQAGVPV